MAHLSLSVSRYHDKSAGVSQEVSKEVSKEVSSKTTLTFREAMDKARRQVDPRSFCALKMENGEMVLYRTRESDMVESLLLAMGEIYSAPPTKTFYVGREEKRADDIACVYEMIDESFMEQLVSRLVAEVGGATVKYQRPYLRTVLYNEVFEGAFKTAAAINNLSL